MVRCPSCGQETGGDYCEWCKYPILSGLPRQKKVTAIEEPAPARRTSAVKILSYVILVLFLLAAGLFAGLYLADYGPGDVVRLVEEKTRGVIVNFADENLEAAIMEALDKSPGQAITSAELAKLTVLRVSKRDISDLSGIEYCSDLTFLNLSSNEITDISSLASLTNLSFLNLNSNHISDLSPLVENSGLGEGDQVWLWNNNLDLSEGSNDLENIR